MNDTGVTGHELIYRYKASYRMGRECTTVFIIYVQTSNKQRKISKAEEVFMPVESSISADCFSVFT
jgi:hypothetical protein